MILERRRAKLGDRAAPGWGKLTDGGFLELGHMLPQHFGIPRAVGPQLRVEAGAQVVGGTMTAPGVAGRDLGVPMRHHDVIPVNVVTLAARAPIPRVVEGVQIRVDTQTLPRGGLGLCGGRPRGARRARGAWRRRRRRGWGCRGPGGGRGGPLRASLKGRQLQAWAQSRESVGSLQRAQAHEGAEGEEQHQEQRDAGAAPPPGHGGP